MNPEPQVLVHIEKSVDLTIFDVKWIPESARLVAMGSTARGNGVLEVYSMAKGQLNLIHKVCEFTVKLLLLDHLALFLKI